MENRETHVHTFGLLLYRHSPLTLSVVLTDPVINMYMVMYVQTLVVNILKAFKNFSKGLMVFFIFLLFYLNTLLLVIMDNEIK